MRVSPQPWTPRLIAGAGEAASLADRLPDGPCLFVTDQQIIRLGLADECRAALEAGGSPVVLFDAVEADPSRATLLAAVAAGQAAGVQSVIGFGGGSPMDVAKLAAYLIGSETIWRKSGAWISRKRAVCAGAGADNRRYRSEATPISVSPATAGSS